MQNPFISQLGDLPEVPESLQAIEEGSSLPSNATWQVKKDKKTGSVITDTRLRVKLTNSKQQDSSPSSEAILEDVYALGDCAIVEGTSYPATAQVASQKASWLAKRLNKSDIDKAGFTWKNMGTLAYIGNWNALFQGGERANISGRLAWLIWRGAYLTKSVSWRNKILIPVYW